MKHMRLPWTVALMLAVSACGGGAAPAESAAPIAEEQWEQPQNPVPDPTTEPTPTVLHPGELSLARGGRVVDAVVARTHDAYLAVWSEVKANTFTVYFQRIPLEGDAAGPLVTLLQEAASDDVNPRFSPPDLVQGDGNALLLHRHQLSRVDVLQFDGDGELIDEVQPYSVRPGGHAVLTRSLHQGLRVTLETDDGLTLQDM